MKFLFGPLSLESCHFALSISQIWTVSTRQFWRTWDMPLWLLSTWHTYVKKKKKKKSCLIEEHGCSLQDLMIRLKWYEFFKDYNNCFPLIILLLKIGWFLWTCWLPTWSYSSQNMMVMPLHLILGQGSKSNTHQTKE